MTSYTPTPDFYNDYICHGPLGWVKKNHKYISRERGKNGKWKYIYTKAKSKISKITNKIDKDHDYILDIFDRNISQPSAMKDDPRYSKSLKPKMAEFENSQKKVYKYYAKIKLANGKYRYFYSADEYNRYLKRSKVLDKDYDFMQDVPTFASKQKASTVVQSVDIGTKAGNCSSCTMAFELAMRGYAVQSKPDIDGASEEEITSNFKDLEYKISDNWYLDTTRKENKNYNGKGFLNLTPTTNEEKLQIAKNDLERSIKERGGDNQRGFIRISWTNTGEAEGRQKAGGAHIFNYVVENGQVKYYDSQKDDTDGAKGQEIDIKDYLDKTDYLTHNYQKNLGGYSTYMGFYRVDNKDLNENVKDFINYNTEEVHDAPEEKKIWVKTSKKK